MSCRPFCRSDVSGTLGENGQPGGCVVGAHGEMELRVVGVLVILYAVVSDDVGDWAAVDREQQRSKHRPLRDAHVEFSGMSFVVAHLDELSPAFKI